MTESAADETSSGRKQTEKTTTTTYSMHITEHKPTTGFTTEARERGDKTEEI